MFWPAGSPAERHVDARGAAPAVAERLMRSTTRARLRLGKRARRQQRDRRVSLATIRNKAEAAYRRGTLLQPRAVVMDRWARFTTQKTADAKWCRSAKQATE